MVELNPSLSVKGESFSPSQCEQSSGLAFSEKTEPGEICTRGKFKDKPSPFGFGSIAPPEDVPSTDRLDWIITNVLPNVAALRDAGAERIWVYLGVDYTDQCSLWFKSEDIQSIGDAGVSLAITCIDMTEEE